MLKHSKITVWEEKTRPPASRKRTIMYWSLVPSTSTIHSVRLSIWIDFLLLWHNLILAKRLHFHMRRNLFSEIGKFLPSFGKFDSLKRANMTLSERVQMSKVFLFIIRISEMEIFYLFNFCHHRRKHFCRQTDSSVGYGLPSVTQCYCLALHCLFCEA